MTAFTRIANIPPDAEQAAERAAEQAAAKQFERLKDQDTNVLSTETFAELVRTHCSGHDLENVVDAITWAVPNPDRLNIRHDGASMNVDMNFEAFSCVCSGEVLKMASHGIKRDLEQIHEALHQEMIHALYEDDDHMPADYRIAIQKPLGISVIFLELMPALVVLCHIIVLGISQDVAPDSIVWVIVDLAFSAFYLCEAIAKMYIFTPKGYFCGPDLAWHWLETVCLIMSILDFIIVQAMQVSQEGLENFVFLRLIRLCRLARLTKVLKSLMRTKLFREVHLMADGMASGARVLVWAVVLIVAINYVLALLANIFFSETLEFTTVASSMCTLFRCFTDGCEDYTGKPLMEQVRIDHGTPTFFVYALVHVVISVGVFNLIMALFIDSVTGSQERRKQKDLSDSQHSVELAIMQTLIRLILQSAASGIPPQVEAEITALAKAEDMHPSARIFSQFACLTETDFEITRDQFSVWLDDAELLSVLETADIAFQNREALFDALDADLGGRLGIEELFDGLLKLRGPVTKADIIAIRMQVRHLVSTAVDA